MADQNIVWADIIVKTVLLMQCFESMCLYEREITYMKIIDLQFENKFGTPLVFPASLNDFTTFLASPRHVVTSKRTHPLFLCRHPTSEDSLGPPGFSFVPLALAGY